MRKFLPYILIALLATGICYAVWGNQSSAQESDCDCPVTQAEWNQLLHVVSELAGIAYGEGHYGLGNPLTGFGLNEPLPTWNGEQSPFIYK